MVLATRPRPSPLVSSSLLGNDLGGTIQWDTGRTINVNGPDGSVVTVVGSQSFTVVRVPDVDDVVLGCGEEEVTLGIVLNLCGRAGASAAARESGGRVDERVRERSCPERRMGRCWRSAYRQLGYIRRSGAARTIVEGGGGLGGEGEEATKKVIAHFEFSKKFSKSVVPCPLP